MSHLPTSLVKVTGTSTGPEQSCAVFIVDSVLSLSLSDMTPGSFVCSGRLTGVDFCAAILHLVLTSVSDIFINFYQD